MISNSILEAIGHTPLVRLQRMTSPDMAEVRTFMRDMWGDMVEDGGEGWHYGRIWFKRDPSWPEHGTAHFEIREYLTGFDYVWTAQRDLEY